MGAELSYSNGKHKLENDSSDEYSSNDQFDSSYFRKFDSGGTQLLSHEVGHQGEVYWYIN
jgi:hypothetical protein